MDATGFIKERVDLFKDFTAERIKQLVEGSRVGSFEAAKRSLITAPKPRTSAWC